MNAALSMFPERSYRDHATVNGWKAISSELDRSVRTVQRWERELRLPIHRLGNGPRSPVFAFEEELHLWLCEIAGEDLSRQSVRKPKPAIIVSIENLFNAQLARPKQGRCSHCRSDMKHLDVHFWLHGSRKGWRVSVPFCPSCEPELCKHSPAIVH